MTATYTPLQRPDALGTKAFYTEEEAIAAFKKAADADAKVDPRDGALRLEGIRHGGVAGRAPRPNLRTSLIVDPDDGRLPPLTPEAQKRRAAAAAAAKLRDPAVGVRTFGNLYTRCVHGLGRRPARPRRQSRGGIGSGRRGCHGGGAVLPEPGLRDDRDAVEQRCAHHPARRPPAVPSQVRQWLGDSRGRWEGNTLVVETTNFNDKTPATNFQGSTDAIARGRTVHTDRPEYDPLPVHHHRSEHLDASVERRYAAAQSRTGRRSTSLPATSRTTA